MSLLLQQDSDLILSLLWDLWCKAWGTRMLQQNTAAQGANHWENWCCLSGMGQHHYGMVDCKHKSGTVSLEANFFFMPSCLDSICLETSAWDGALSQLYSGNFSLSWDGATLPAEFLGCHVATCDEWQPLAFSTSSQLNFYFHNARPLLWNISTGYTSTLWHGVQPSQGLIWPHLWNWWLGGSKLVVKWLHLSNSVYQAQPPSSHPPLILLPKLWVVVDYHHHQIHIQDVSSD